jgi:FtsZ-binding cell division protein ZapB
MEGLQRTGTQVKRKQPLHRLVYSRIKKKSPKIPDITCPAIDDVILRLEKLSQTTQNLNLRTCKVLTNKLEKLRRANEQLRDSGVYWNQAVKDLIDKYVVKRKKPKF